MSLLGICVIYRNWDAKTLPCGEAPFRKILATVPTNRFQLCSEVEQKYLVARGAGATN